MNKSYPPTFHNGEFHCPLCGVYAQQTWNAMCYQFFNISSVQVENFEIAICTHCKRPSIWENGKIVFPSVIGGVPPHEDLPEELKADYQEARAIVKQSPRAAAALIRLILQKLMPHIGGVGENINIDIAALSKTLPVEVQQAMDVCRLIGNQAVHPGEINFNDTPEIAYSLFELINFIVEECVAKKKRVAALFDGLPERKKQEIAKRDGNTAE